MHDVVRSFAEYMAREESAVVVDDKQAATCGSGGSGMLCSALRTLLTINSSQLEP